MWRALTLKDVNGLNVALSTSPAQLEAERLAYWATTFRSVGDVVHLMQDMAQPQHTRNEEHGTGRNAVFEAYANARVGGSTDKPVTTYEIDAGTLSVSAGTLRPLDYELRDLNGALTPYPTPRFNNYTDYWTTARGAAPRPQSISAGQGLADYSSRGFLTLGTSLNGATFSEFESPPRLSSDPSYTATAAVDLCDSSGSSFLKTKYLLRDVVDLMVPSATQNIKLQSRSVWNTIGATFYTMNHCVMDDHLRLLIPRAVAYSASLIDYFFRGQLEIGLPSEGVYAILDHSVPGDNCKDTCGFRTVKLKLANSTPVITVSGPNGTTFPQDMTGGRLVAVAKYHKNKCYTTDLEGEYDSSINSNSDTYINDCRDTVEEIAVSQPLTGQNVTTCDAIATTGANGCQTRFNTKDVMNPAYIPSLTFNFTTPIPINATDLYLQVVYRGPLGSEQDAVVVGTKDIAEPTYFSIVNTTDYRICYNRDWYYKDSNGNLPASIPAEVEGLPKEMFYAPTNYNYWRVAFQPNEASFTETPMKTPIAKVENLAPMEYSRIAVLIEPGRRYNDEIAGYRAPQPAPFTLANASTLQINYTPTGSAQLDMFDYKLATVRKVKATVPLSGHKYNLQTSGGDCTDVAIPPEPMFPPYPKPTAMKAVTITLDP